MNEWRLSRRAFVVHGAMAFAAGRFTTLGATPPPIQLRIGLLESPLGESDDRSRGTLFGVEEAHHAAAMFNGRVELVRVPRDARLPTGLTALVADADADRCRSLAAEGERAGVLVFNVACAADELRGACVPTFFHVAPSVAMERDALREVGGDGRVVAWDAELSRYGADTLNQRFEKRFDVPMTSDAWCGWLAVKIVWEAALRGRTGVASEIGKTLAADTLQFDGHKGRPLSFRTWDHQLRQPVYVKAARTLREAPAGAGGESDTSRDVLDRLGAKTRTSECR